MTHFYVVDDDAAIRRLTAAFLERAGHNVRTFADAAAFKVAFDADGKPDDCVLLDLDLPGEGGQEIQDWLADRAEPPKVFVITGEVDVPTAVTLMRRGAKDLLIKPFTERELLDRISDAITRHDTRVEATPEQKQAIGQLTPREREVFELVAAGDANKQVAFKLGISQRTVEVHRGRVMQKLNADSLADLVVLAIATGTRQAV
ncbi:MAG: LuxR C-terminal-related transcriptional regulator [Planctomycetota bacterium]